jgi:hypothetical protein
MATEFNHARAEFLVRATDTARYPHLDAADLAALRPLAEPRTSICLRFRIVSLALNRLDQR